MKAPIPNPVRRLSLGAMSSGRRSSSASNIASPEEEAVLEVLERPQLVLEEVL